MMSFFRKLDWTLLLTALFIAGISLLTLYSLSSNGGADYFFRQAIYMVLGIGVMFFMATLDYLHVAKYSTAIYFVTLGALLLVLLFGVTVRGTAGWLSLGIFQIQPVELAKVSLILFLA